MEIREILKIFGYAGAVTFMANYLLISTGRMRAGSYSFHFTILFGAMTVGANAYMHQDYPVVYLEIFGCLTTFYFFTCLRFGTAQVNKFLLRLVPAFIKTVKFAKIPKP